MSLIASFKWPHSFSYPSARLQLSNHLAFWHKLVLALWHHIERKSQHRKKLLSLSREDEKRWDGGHLLDTWTMPSTGCNRTRHLLILSILFIFYCCQCYYLDVVSLLSFIDVPSCACRLSVKDYTYWLRNLLTYLRTHLSWPNAQLCPRGWSIPPSLTPTPLQWSSGNLRRLI